MLGVLLSPAFLPVLLLPTADAQKEAPAATSVVVQPGAPGEPSKTLPQRANRLGDFLLGETRRYVLGAVPVEGL